MQTPGTCNRGGTPPCEDTCGRVLTGGSAWRVPDPTSRVSGGPLDVWSLQDEEGGPRGAHVWQVRLMGSLPSTITVSLPQAAHL